MDSNEQLSRREQVDFRDQAHANGGRPHLSAAARSLSADRMDGEGSGYTLMVAGRRTGKTAFLRLLLDTSLISPTATQDQLASVAKFVQGCGGYTSHIRTVSVNVDLAVGAADKAELQTLTLTLIDTPSLDFEDAGTGQRTVDEILRHVDARFSDSAEDEHKALTGDQHVHLCVYFLDPDDIVPPPSVSVQPAPMMSRARNNSLSKPELEPVILEPPVTTLPLLCRPTLPQADIATIRRLSARVNVLPVVGRADVLTNDRLTAVKVAVRRDLAAAGIGFGIFDNTPQHPIYGTDLGIIVPSVSEHTNGYNGHAHGSASTASSPPSTPISSTPLPYALISPDIYSHSDGVSRPALSRHELVIQYTPSYSNASMHHSITKIIPQKWTRTYRWGSLDCMDANHCDFLQLRGAIFHHMKTLQKYTREFLYERFKADYQIQKQPPPRTQRSPVLARVPLSQNSRPILAIDTAPAPAVNNRQASGSISRSSLNGESVPPPLSAQTSLMPDLSPKTASSSKSQRTRAKKITVACNFCRSRKLKCDGGRPACGQCFKRSNTCDYMTNHKRRGSGKRRKFDEGSESDGECDSGDPSGDIEPSQSPEVHSVSHSRRNSNAMEMIMEDVKLPPLNGNIIHLDRREEPPPKLLSIIQSPTSLMQAPPERTFINHHELPPIATLPVTPSGSSIQDYSQTLPPLRQPVEIQPGSQPQRRRTSSAASTKGRQNGFGSKIVACNFCRARKTRCDGGHPACGSCARRSLPCNYVNDPAANNPKGRPKMAAPVVGPSASVPPSQQPSPTNRTAPLTGSTNGYIRYIDPRDNGDSDLKRNLEAEHTLPNKKMRVTDDLPLNAVTVSRLN